MLDLVCKATRITRIVNGVILDFEPLGWVILHPQSTIFIFRHSRNRATKRDGLRSAASLLVRRLTWTSNKPGLPRQSSTGCALHEHCFGAPSHRFGIATHWHWSIGNVSRCTRNPAVYLKVLGSPEKVHLSVTVKLHSRTLLINYPKSRHPSSKHRQMPDTTTIVYPRRRHRRHCAHFMLHHLVLHQY